MGQKRVLLGLVEAMNLIYKQNRPAIGVHKQILGILHNLLDILHTRRNGIKLEECRLGGIGDNPSNGCLAVPGGPNRMMEEILSAWIIRFNSFPSPMMCS
jgi:hypothetical protein